MDPIVAPVLAMIIHLCPFTHEGRRYDVIPATDLVELMRQVKAIDKDMIERMGLIVSITNEGCAPDDGKTVPGVQR